MLRHKIVTQKFLHDLISTIPITLSSICWVCHPQPKIDIISFGDATQEGVKGGGSRSRFTKNKIGISRFMEKKENVFPYTKVTYRFILKNNVQSKALFVFFTIRPLSILRDAKRQPSYLFCISRVAPSTWSCHRIQRADCLLGPPM